MVVVNALERAKTGSLWMMMKREMKLMMSIALNMSVRSGVTQKNTKTSHGRTNAPGLPAAHVLNALTMMLRNNAKVPVTQPKESSILRSNAAKKNVKDAANAKVTVRQLRRQQS
jgi:hypothetical protein